jgi:transcriptional regulator with XRE-family HTH domain
MLSDYELRARRAVERSTQEAFAKKLKISRQFLNRIESGKVLKLSKKLEARYNELYGGKRLISVDFYVPPPCINCGRDVPEDKEPKRVHMGETRDRDVYLCPNCGEYFDGHDVTAIEAKKQKEGK